MDARAVVRICCRIECVKGKSVCREVTFFAAKGMGGPGFENGNFEALECGLLQHHPSWMQIRGYQNALVNHVFHLDSDTVTGLVSR